MLPRRERPVKEPDWDAVIAISIHAPTRGATPGTKLNTKWTQFQSTLPRGERPYIDFTHYKLRCISIHAPARGATGAIQSFLGVIVISIHAPARGATRYMIAGETYPGEFQSTLPRGERLNCMISLPEQIYFNPRSREGSDRAKGAKPWQLADFNPRSREGSDQQGKPQEIRRQSISIHAPARGATAAWPQIRRPGQNFNPRSRKGSDIAIQAALQNYEEFQSTLPQGERHKWHFGDSTYFFISIHAPARGATR